MTEKAKKISLQLENVVEGETKLKVTGLQGIFNCLLIKKHYFDSKLDKIEIRTLRNENPKYEENQIRIIDIEDNSLIEINIIQ